ncbi:MFS transporter [Anaeroarcus burkinensis]|uniref:MFS transporter n=1 Tax=Anaeroarcus burkinensis TaxID=82376 RepID=UPI000480B0B9|nr:MFS transporter [Anaeroarcus burkinensis]
MEYLRKMDRNYLLFLLSTALVGVAQSVDGSTLTNYLRDGLGMMILERSALEFPRELPGLFMVGIIGMLAFLGDTRTMMLGNLFSAAGMFALGMIPPDYALVVVSIFVYNVGTHIYMPLSNSIGMSFASASDLGRSLGRMNAVNTLTLVLSSAVLWVLFTFWHISYTTAFTIGAIAFVLAAVPLFFMKPLEGTRKTPRFVFRKEYKLYYWLSVLFGARKQIFITFGPWVLVDIFRQPVAMMTLLFFIVSIAGIFVKPWLGSAIDRYGEKQVLSGEAICFLLVCLGYAFAADLLPYSWALLLICFCYIVDQALNAVSMARATYMRKIALAPEDISPSLSLGTSIDHLVTMVLPILGGFVWYNSGPNGYKYVFLGGAVIALLNFISARFIHIKEAKAEGVEHGKLKK